MKKLLIVSLLLLNASAFAKTTEYTGLTSTPNDQDTTVMRQNACIWGQGPTSNEDRRIKVDANGNLLISSGGGGTASAVTVIADTSPQTFALLTNTAALLATQNLALGALTFTANSRNTFALNPTSGTAVQSTFITFTAKASLVLWNPGPQNLTFTVTNSATPPLLSTAGAYQAILSGDLINLNAMQGTLTSSDTYVHTATQNSLTGTGKNTW